MPKTLSKKRNNSAASNSTTPYSHRHDGKEAAKVNNIFKMNTNIGQHVLKNPGVAQAIVDKAGLRQSDVCIDTTNYLHYHNKPSSNIPPSFSRLC